MDVDLQHVAVFFAVTLNVLMFLVLLVMLVQNVQLYRTCTTWLEKVVVMAHLPLIFGVMVCQLDTIKLIISSYH